MKVPPVRCSCVRSLKELNRSCVPVSVCVCCDGVRCGCPCGCFAERSVGGPCRVCLWMFVYGLPLATDQVSHGGAKMAACTRLREICSSQNLMVLLLRRSWWL